MCSQARSFSKEDISKSEAVMNQIATVFGEDLVSELVEAFGGTRVYLPAGRFASPDGKLAKFFGGIERANEFLEKAGLRIDGYRTICLPRWHTTLSFKLACGIQDDLRASDLPVAAIAQKYGVSERTIYKHIATLKNYGLVRGNSRLRRKR